MYFLLFFCLYAHISACVFFSPGPSAVLLRHWPWRRHQAPSEEAGDALRDRGHREGAGEEGAEDGQGDLQGVPGPRQAHGHGQAHGLAGKEHLHQDQGKLFVRFFIDRPM